MSIKFYQWGFSMIGSLKHTERFITSGNLMIWTKIAFHEINVSKIHIELEIFPLVLHSLYTILANDSLETLCMIILRAWITRIFHNPCTWPRGFEVSEPKGHCISHSMFHFSGKLSYATWKYIAWFFKKLGLQTREMTKKS